MVEKEYIERKALLEDIDETVIFTVKTVHRNLEIRGANKVIDRIKAVPTADVQEVRHAEWVLQENKHPEAVCSNCGREVVYQIVNNRWEFENYCPHCGAKMDKE